MREIYPSRDSPRKKTEKLRNFGVRVSREASLSEVKMKDERIAELKRELDEMREKQLENLPVDAKEEVRAVKEKLKENQEARDWLNGEKFIICFLVRKRFIRH